jgi:uncharacterized protein (UPF0335 family)
MMGRRKQNNGASDQAPKIGHNSNLTDEQKVKLSGAVSEIERVEAEMASLAGEKGEIYKSLKEAGFDTKAIRHTVRLRKMERSKRNEFEAAVEAYALALGDFATTALGQAARPREGAHA